MTLLLISGLSLEKANSFNRQLTLLGAALREQGAHVLIAGPATGSSGGSMVQGHLSGSGKNDNRYTVGRNMPIKQEVHAALLLGYPDQFPLLQAQAMPGFPLFLWAQFSRPPDSATLCTALPVPLTPMTGQFLMESGLQCIGPVIPHGINLSLYHPLTREQKRASRAEWGLHDGLVIGTVGAHSPRKRLDLIIRTLSHLQSMGMKTQLLIKTDHIRSIDGTDLDELARRYGVLAGVKIVTGELTESEMRSLYNCMDIYLNLSEWEGFCIPVLEAMACGIPVACLPLQGPGEIMPYEELFIRGYRQFDEKGTLLCEASPKEAAELILHAAGKPAMLKDLGRLGIQEIQRRFDIRVVAQHWLELMAG
jgi:glycosyltransferase involved in cell wall biosynthesis